MLTMHCRRVWVPQRQDPISEAETSEELVRTLLGDSDYGAVREILLQRCWG